MFNLTKCLTLVTLGSGYFVTVTDYPDPNVTFMHKDC